MRMRSFLLGDVPSVSIIESTVSSEPWSETLFAGEFDMSVSARNWLVAETDDSTSADDSEVVAFGGMMFVADVGHLMNVAVRPDHQRRGIARDLCAALFEDAKQRGMAALTLEVRVSNGPARELYRRFGFQPVGCRSGYYTNVDGSKEDGLIFWLHDLQTADLGQPVEKQPIDTRSVAEHSVEEHSVEKHSVERQGEATR